jgi:mannosyltransferase
VRSHRRPNLDAGPSLAAQPSLAARHGLAALLALATLATLIWRLGRPALWLDEGASVVATQRTWPNVWLLLHGADAPLVPYYALLKAVTTAIVSLDPAAALHPEVLYRLPSVVAVTLAVWALALWLARFCPPGLVLSTGAVLLSIGGLSRYGQEVRPYAVVLLLAVTSTILWAQLVNDAPGRLRRWLPLYALSISLLVAAHNLAAGLLAAHVVAALVATEPGRRRPALLRTVAGGGLGLALVSPFAIMAVRHGTGAGHFVTLTPIHLAANFLRLFTLSDHPFVRLGAPLALAVIGLARVTSARYRFVARLAAAWAIVPLVVWIAAVKVRPNLLIGRYVLFTIPAWAILGGLGVVTIFELVHWTSRRLTPAAAVAGLLIGATVASQLFTLQDVRTTAGHGEDIKPALARADTGQDARLPIYVSSQIGAVEIPAYDLADDNRLLGITIQRNLARMIWPSEDSYAVRKQLLTSDPKVLLLMRATAVPGCTVGSQGNRRYVTRCMPALLQRLKFRVLATQARGREWTLALLAHAT